MAVVSDKGFSGDDFEEFLASPDVELTLRQRVEATLACTELPVNDLSAWASSDDFVRLTESPLS